jgi:hypothetical protein
MWLRCSQMSDVFWGAFYAAVGVAMIAARRTVLKEMRRWYDRSWHFRWRPHLWGWDVLWWVGCAAWIAFGAAFIVEGVSG